MIEDAEHKLILAACRQIMANQHFLLNDHYEIKRATGTKNPFGPTPVSTPMFDVRKDETVILIKKIDEAFL